MEGEEEVVEASRGDGMGRWSSDDALCWIVCWHLFLGTVADSHLPFAELLQAGIADVLV